MLKLKPGVMVACSSSVKGGVEYVRRELEHQVIGSTDVLGWETTRTIEDVDEHAAAVKARSSARNRIARVCVQTPFGWISTAPEAELNRAIAEAAEIVETHNAGARYCRVRLSILRALIAQDDVEAVRSIRAEISDLLDLLERATLDRDPKAIKDVTKRSVQLGKLLEKDSAGSGELAEAVEAARKVARKIRAEVKKGVEAAEVEISEAAISPVSKARALFIEADQLDLPEVEAAPVAGPRLVEAAPVAEVEAEAVAVEIERPELYPGALDEIAEADPDFAASATRKIILGQDYNARQLAAAPAEVELNGSDFIGPDRQLGPKPPAVTLVEPVDDFIARTLAEVEAAETAVPGGDDFDSWWSSQEAALRAVS